MNSSSNSKSPTLLSNIFSSMHLKSDFISGSSDYYVAVKYALSFDSCLQVLSFFHECYYAINILLLTFFTINIL